jgi:hypothetical protein
MVADEATCGEDELAQVGWDYPPWYAWRGVGGIVYARRPRSSPPMLVRSATTQGLREAIEEAERERGLRPGMDEV